MTRTPSICPTIPGCALAVRPITVDDTPFLCEVYASTRREELAPLGWSATQLDTFLTMQFHAQHAHYQQHYTRTAFDIILLNQVPIGRMYHDRWDHEWRLVDIALLPAYRGQGIGTAFLQTLLHHAADAGLAVSAHVELFNPAQRLYARLGFTKIGEHGVYHLLRAPTEQYAHA